MLRVRRPQTRVNKYLHRARRRMAEADAKDRAKGEAEPKRHIGGTPEYLHPLIPNGAWAGQRCFIIGGGPSLRGFDYGCLRNELVIGVNRAYEKIDPAILFSMDARLLGWILLKQIGDESFRKFLSILGTKVWFRETTSTGYDDGIYIVDWNGREEFAADLVSGFGKSNNSGFSALNLACALGATEIYLLGFDMHGESGKQKWWHNGYPIVQDDTTYRDRMIPLFERHSRTIHATGARVINCNPTSALHCFEFGGLPPDVGQKDRPLVIGYYTRNTSYETEIQGMIASAHRMGLECDVRGIDTLGGWQANTYYKAQFIRDMMDTHPDRPLLFLDADVLIRRYPAIFDGLDADLAVSVVDWSAYPNHSRNDTELNTSVIYLRPNERTRLLINTWISVNERMIQTGVLEQVNLQMLLADWREPLKVRYLPDTYCQIFDLMADAGDPVIELFQASRRLKEEVGA